MWHTNGTRQIFLQNLIIGTFFSFLLHTTRNSRNILKLHEAYCKSVKPGLIFFIFSFRLWRQRSANPILNKNLFYCFTHDGTTGRGKLSPPLPPTAI
jgi:hypothetical protein